MKNEIDSVENEQSKTERLSTIKDMMMHSIETEFNVKNAEAYMISMMIITGMSWQIIIDDLVRETSARTVGSS